MLLYLFRHGVAIDPADPECPPDAERPLTRASLTGSTSDCRSTFPPVTCKTDGFHRVSFVLWSTPVWNRLA